MTIEYTVNGTSHGTTIWKGEFFDCLSEEVALPHYKFIDRYDECNNGSVVGKGLKIEDNHYTSQLNVSLEESMIGKTIECHYEGGGQTFIDSVIINTTGMCLHWAILLILMKIHPHGRLDFGFGQSEKIICISHRINQFSVSAPSRCRKFTTEMQLNQLCDPSGIH